MSGAVAVRQVWCETIQVTRNLPGAHASWQFWRTQRFRQSVDKLVRDVYHIDVDGLTDQQLDRLIDGLDTAEKLIQVHMRTVRGDRRHFEQQLRRLATAREGFQQGLPADPARRPSDEDMMQTLSAGLQRAGAV